MAYSLPKLQPPRQCRHAHWACRACEAGPSTPATIDRLHPPLYGAQHPWHQSTKSFSWAISGAIPSCARSPAAARSPQPAWPRPSNGATSKAVSAANRPSGTTWSSTTARPKSPRSIYAKARPFTSKGVCAPANGKTRTGKTATPPKSGWTSCKCSAAVAKAGKAAAIRKAAAATKAAVATTTPLPHSKRARPRPPQAQAPAQQRPPSNPQQGYTDFEDDDIPF